jgi:hypothetical protein
MAYTITISQLPIVGGTAGHNYIVLKDGDTVVSEINGLATNALGHRIPVGTSDTDRLKVYEDSGGYFYRPSAPQSLVFSGSEAEALALWKRAQDAMSAMNALNLPYPPLGFNIFSPTINSNSVASTLLKVMGLAEPSLGSRLTPGAGNVILSPSAIANIQNANPIPASTTAGGDIGDGGLGHDQSPGDVQPPREYNPPPPDEYDPALHAVAYTYSIYHDDGLWETWEYNIYGDLIGYNLSYHGGASYHEPFDAGGEKDVVDQPVFDSALTQQTTAHVSQFDEGAAILSERLTHSMASFGASSTVFTSSTFAQSGDLVAHWESIATTQ